MRCGVIMDPIERIKPAKDTTLGLLLEAQNRGYQLQYFTPEDLLMYQGHLTAYSTPIQVMDNDKHWYEALDEPGWLELSALDVILMRQDPPVNQRYYYVTYLLQQLQKSGVTIVNPPEGVRAIHEKLAILCFPQYTPTTLVSCHIKAIDNFIADNGQAIIKPLWEMGGQDIYYLTPDDANKAVILESLTQKGSQAIMAQQYLSAIRHGDKRIVVINGEPSPYALLRVPHQNATRANLAAGGQGEGAQLTDHEYQLSREVGQLLRQHGIILAGLDVIGGYLTEINVTSPTCLREINNAFQVNLCGEVFDTLMTFN